MLMLNSLFVGGLGRAYFFFPAHLLVTWKFPCKDEMIKFTVVGLAEIFNEF